MIVQAKCVYRAWDSTQARLYVPNGGNLPGGLYELDLSNPAHRKLVELKTQMGEFIFQFDRMSANNTSSGVYFCADCGSIFASLNLLGTHSRQVHKKTGCKPNDAEPESEPDPEPEGEEDGPSNSAGDRRGIGPRRCKGCNQPFDSIHALVMHKPICPGKSAEVIASEVIEEVAQEPPA
jgi:hypothetical protein